MDSLIVMKLKIVLTISKHDFFKGYDTQIKQFRKTEICDGLYNYLL